MNEKKISSALVFIITKTWKLFKKKTVNFKSKKCSSFVHKFLSVVKEIEKILIVGSRYFAKRRLKECKEIRNEIISDSRDSNWNYLDQSNGKQFKRQPNQCAKNEKGEKIIEEANKKKSAQMCYNFFENSWKILTLKV